MIEFITSKMTVWVRPMAVSSVQTTESGIQIWVGNTLFMFGEHSANGTKEEGYQLLELLRPDFGVKQTISDVIIKGLGDGE